MSALLRLVTQSFAVAFCLCGSWVCAQTVSLESLLNEMTDRSAITLAPNYVCKQASSYDRAAKSPDENWFANNDTSQFIRVEQNGDREESVLFEAEGPGAVVRWWVTAPHYKSNLYVYIDGEAEPAISGNILDLLGGDALAGAPLSAERARGQNLYLPIPYGKSIKITCDNMKEQGNLYYQINYRTYPKDVEVESFTRDVFEALKDKIAATNAALLEPGKSVEGGERQGYKRRLSADMLEGLEGAFRIGGPGAITEIDVKLTADDIAAATRNVVLSISFDGEETVWVPVGEFFGSGVGVNPYKSWYTEVTDDGVMKAYWRMPYKKEARVSFINYGGEDVDVDYSVYYEKAPWLDNTMYFHANWRQERGIETVGGNGTKDWNYTALQGTGVYVGDVLSVVNSVPEWWGEGDEKIYVDGETFPSHFGTGTEDYYGYAWCTPQFFEDPFHAQPRCEGPANFGNTTNLRFRSLDAIPFANDFRFDMEVWHWAATTVDYAVATFWYGLPGATVNVEFGPSRDAVEDEAAAPVEYDRKFTYTLGNMTVSEASAGSIAIQTMNSFKVDSHFWKDDKQIWWRDGKPGDKLTIDVKDVPVGKKTLVLGATVARDYGCFQLYWNGEKIGKPLDFFFEPRVEHRVVKLSVPKTTDSEGILTVEVLEKNEKSAGTMFGVDYIEWE